MDEAKKQEARLIPEVTRALLQWDCGQYVISLEATATFGRFLLVLGVLECLESIFSLIPASPGSFSESLVFPEDLVF